jgi:hypothetical protein
VYVLMGYEIVEGRISGVQRVKYVPGVAVAIAR